MMSQFPHHLEQILRSLYKLVEEGCLIGKEGAALTAEVPGRQRQVFEHQRCIRWRNLVEN